MIPGVYQIYYDEETRKMGTNIFTPYYNPTLTPFFENSVIEDLCRKGAHMEHEFFGVLSPVFFSKAMGGGVKRQFIAEKLSRCDLLSFWKGDNRNIITQGDHYHLDRKPGHFSR